VLVGSFDRDAQDLRRRELQIDTECDEANARKVMTNERARVEVRRDAVHAREPTAPDIDHREHYTRGGPPGCGRIRPPMGDDQDVGSDVSVALGSVDGIEVVLRGVQCTSDGVVIHLYGRPSERTDRLDADYRAAFEGWARLAVAAKKRGERAPDPPPQPGELLNGLELTLRDDVNTTYRWQSTQAGGSGTEWDAVWRFTPRPPPEARDLTVAIDSADSRPYSRRL
jgi:hypothetical protein